MLSDIGSVFGKQVAVYTIGGGDNSVAQWFSDPDPSVKQLQFGAVTRQGDKLAFVASTQNPQDEIRLYQANGPIPNQPTAMCALTGATGGQFSYPSFSPDGSELVWQESDGIHAGSMANLGDCSSITDQLILPGASQPYFGPADVNMANAPTPPAQAGSPGGAGSSARGSSAGASGNPIGHSHRARHRHRVHRHRRRHGGPRRTNRAAHAVDLRPRRAVGALHSRYAPKDGTGRGGATVSTLTRASTMTAPSGLAISGLQSSSTISGCDSTISLMRKRTSSIAPMSQRRAPR
jgi:hypothetical protein